MNGFRNQGALTLITRIKPGETQNLRNLLAQMVRGKDNPDVDVETNDIVPFAKLTTIHFARFVVVDQSLNESGELEKIDPLHPPQYEGAKVLLPPPTVWNSRSSCYCTNAFAKSPAITIEILSGSMWRRMASRSSSGVTVAIFSSIAASHSRVRPKYSDCASIAANDPSCARLTPRDWR